MWLPVMNAIRADPELRGRYQFWVFYYPTANPVPLSALALRDDLGTVERLYRPKHGFVLVGHSMGGLVCRMQVVNTGRVLWDECFNPEAERFYAQVPADSASCLCVYRTVAVSLPKASSAAWACG
jgi:hypothetical protein